MIFRRISVVVGAAGLLALPATAAQAAPAAQGTSAAPGSPAAQGTQAASAVRVAQVASEQDVSFLQAVHQDNLAEVGAGRIAWTSTADPNVKRVAAALMRDHIRLDADLYSVARRLRVSLPDTPTREQEALANRYRLAPANTFDEYFISTQLAGHRADLRLIAAQIETGTDRSVVQLAAKARTVIEHHRQLLRDAAEARGMAGYLGTGGRNG
ncbi:DUF4142 domain-containing protein [Actinoplanes siamensis]|uniref:DUF4142 domain-containing protein n=1 Tax=Actinoplanes siamensis TaxID=1223317 RepID=A0A919N3H1_9ACTN|nr:DUF4142 domain-containing protein [Actinoplanes siamensis]GIF03676.1 hypothetical protein Asi03nite_12140 [Actinoplanes siamensis]